MLAWLLFRKTLRTSWPRVSLLAVGIAMGVVVLLACTAAFNALGATSQRAAWRTSAQETLQKAAARGESIIPGEHSERPNALYIAVDTMSTTNVWHNKPIAVTLLHAGGVLAPRLSGMPTPAEGEYYVSPGLATIMQQHPQDRLGDRFGQKNLGVIPNQYVTSPDSLQVIAGVDKSQIETAGLQPIYSLNEHGAAAFFIDKLITAILYLGTSILLFPVVLLISIAAQLGSAQREQRYAALRLVGATRLQVNKIITAESLFAAAPGMVAGWLVYVAVLPLLREIRFSGDRFWPQDLSIAPAQYLSIFCGTLLVVLFANWWGMRHVRTSPLGVVRRQKTTRAPRWWRTIPLVAGVGLITAGRLSAPENRATADQVYLVIAGVVLVMIGLVLAGPWLTRHISNVFSRCTARPTVLLGTRYISVHAATVFRSVSGVVVALFAASFYLTTVSSLDEISANGYSQLRQQTVLISSYGGPLAIKESALSGLPSVGPVRTVDMLADAYAVMSCSDAPRFTTIVCPAGSEFVGVNFWAPATEAKVYGTSREDIAQQLTDEHNGVVDPARTEKAYLLVTNKGSLEQVRSVVARMVGVGNGSTLNMVSGQDAQQPSISPIIKSLSGLAYVGIAVTVGVSILSLCVSTVGGLFERRRSLYTLRLGGMTIAQLKRMVIIESLIPLVAVSVVSAGCGVGIGYVFMDMVSASLDAKLSPLYIVVTMCSLVAAGVAVYLILPVVRTLTDVHYDRGE